MLLEKYIENLWKSILAKFKMIKNKKSFEKFAWSFKNESDYEEELEEEGLDIDEEEKLYFGVDEE